MGGGENIRDNPKPVCSASVKLLNDLCTGEYVKKAFNLFRGGSV